MKFSHWVWSKLRKLRIWSHLLKKSLMENFSFCAVVVPIADAIMIQLFWFNPHYKLIGFRLLFLYVLETNCIWLFWSHYLQSQTNYSKKRKRKKNIEIWARSSSEWELCSISAWHTNEKPKTGFGEKPPIICWRKARTLKSENY